MEYKKFRAGAGSAEIVFPPEMFPTDRLYGVHDNPHYRVMLFDAGERAAIIAFELVNGDNFEKLSRNIVSEICDVPFENVWMHVSHAITTPHSPGGPAAQPGIINSRPPLSGPKPNSEQDDKDVKEGKKPPVAFHRDPLGEMKKQLFAAAVEKAVREAAEAARDSMRDAKYPQSVPLRKAAGCCGQANDGACYGFRKNSI